jgi:hypothetical protein
MNKQEIISNIETLKSRIESIYDEEKKIDLTYNNDISDFLTPYLNHYNILENGFYLEVSGNYFRISRKRGDENYGREMITISSRERWDDHSTTINKIEVSFYSTSENSIFELERMIVIGKVGQLLLNHNDAIVEGVNNLYSISKDNSRIFSKERWELERQVKEFNKLLDVLNIQEAMDKLKTGINFEDTSRSYPRLRFRGNDDSVIKSLKIANTKGKSAYIEYVSGHSNKISHDTIRIKNLEVFVQYYKDMILDVKQEEIVTE